VVKNNSGYAGMAGDLETHGFLICEKLLAESHVSRLRAELAAAIEKEQRPGHQDHGMLLAAAIYGGEMLNLVEHSPLFAPVNAVLGETCIIHVYTSSSLPPHATNYSTRIHRERSDKYPDIADFVGLIIALDDFTLENGATWYLPGSHRLKTPPTETDFYSEAKRLVMAKGSVFYFDWRLYHAGGENKTSAWRHSLAMGMTPAYHKQKIDLPRAIPEKFAANLGDAAKQKLGFFSVPPVSISEYYERTSYRQKPI